MAVVFKSFFDLYHHMFTTLKDSRSENYLFIHGSPLPMVSVWVAYFALFLLGPKLMKNRKPFELNSLMTMYNLFQVVMNTYFGSKAVYYLLWKYKYNFSCQPVDYSSTEHGLMELHLVYVYFLTKLFDFCDTIFIVLKKKNRQLSFLHCYHHIAIAGTSYVAAKWLPGGPATMVGIVNSFIHVIMYFYYFLTAFKPELKSSIWWKKHLTQAQLAQFLFLVVHYVRGIIAKDCDYPKSIMWFLLLQNIFFLSLFGEFYRRLYLKKAKTN